MNDTYDIGAMKVNGRTKYYDHLKNLKRVPGTKSRWTVEHKGTGLTYHIEGGKHAGGRRDEWFVDGGDINGTINTSSLVDSLNLLENM
jgi:hypothetical protein